MLRQFYVKSEIIRHMKESAAAAMAGDTDAAMNELHKAGQAGEDGVKDYMLSGDFAPNAPVTINGGWIRNRKSGKPVYIKGKGSSKPLMDTGNLQSSVTHVIEG